MEHGERHTLKTAAPRQIPLAVFFALALVSGFATAGMGAPGIAALGATFVAWLTWTVWWGWRAQTEWRVTLDHGGVSIERMVSEIPVDTRRITRGELVGASSRGGALTLATTTGLCVLDRLAVPEEELATLAEGIRRLRGAEGEVPEALGAMGASGRAEPAMRVTRHPFALGGLLLAPFVPAVETRNPWLSGLALRTVAAATVLPLVTGVLLDLAWQLPYQAIWGFGPHMLFATPGAAVVAVLATNLVQGLTYVAWGWVLGLVATVNGVWTNRQIARFGLFGLAWSAFGALLALVAPYLSCVGCFGMSLLELFPTSIALWLPGWEYLVLMLPFAALAAGGMWAEARAIPDQTGSGNS